MKIPYEVLFPYEIVEVLNGVLFVALYWMTLFLVVHLVYGWRNTRKRYLGHGGLLRTVRAMHREYKPEIALLTIVGAFCARTFVLWYVRWLKNNDLPWEDWITENSGELLIWLTATVIVGVTCWIRVISPMSGWTAAAVWFMMVTSSVAFGFGMHYFF